MDTQLPDFKTLYDETLTPCESIGVIDPEYCKAVKKLGDEIEYFTERLSQEDEDRFAALIALYEDVHLIEKREAFEHGFKVSMRMLRNAKKANGKLKPV